jgi:hypothetical protein
MRAARGTLSPMTNHITELVDTYINAWNERVPERRRALVAAAFTDDATYVDPARSGATAGGIDTMIHTAQEQFPGHHIVLAGAPDAHNDHVRFSWTLEPVTGGDVVVVGHDFATVADGRLREVVGFVDAH